MEALANGDPRRVGRYRIEARARPPRYGDVYLGRSPGGRPVAVKVVRPELAADAAFRRRLATIGPDGITVLHTGREKRFPWSEVARVSVYRNRRGWMLAVLPAPGVALPSGVRLLRPFRDRTQDFTWIVLAPVNELRGGHQRVRTAVAAHTGDRWLGTR
ncbi:hypothetical protein [Actinomadura atramentaria]|uniref:hypothetical protein n=1 Tax=Actinomadura atramentaria TaxID=1990 RepID=UPI00035D4D64|nr:hypothetical protein [Actinomadura atramentaria]